MARASFPIDELGPNGGSTDQFTNTAPTADGGEFQNDNSITIVLCRNTGAARVVDVVSVSDENGRTGDISLTVPANGVTTNRTFAAAGPFRAPGFNQSGADAGKVFIDVDSTAGLQFFVLRITPTTSRT